VGRIFNNNTANYMSRASVNLGLNGLTECSFAYWLKVTALDAALEQRIIQKQIADGWSSITSRLEINTTRTTFGVENQTLADFPTWFLTTGIGLGVWARVLFTWKRNAINSTDGLIYINGVSQALTFLANNYAAGTVIEETSNNLYYGIRPVTLTSPLNAALAWVTVWNRQLTSAEAVTDAADPLGILSGRVSQVELCPDTELVFGGSMTVNGTVPCTDGPFGTRIAGGGKRMQSVIYSQG
jgi:hypothetical protein